MSHFSSAPQGAVSCCIVSLDLATLFKGRIGHLTDFDLSTHYEVNERTSIFAKVENLSNKSILVARQPYGARPSQGRSLTIGFSASI